jgi:hypothetical protein
MIDWRRSCGRLKTKKNEDACAKNATSENESNILVVVHN